MENKIIINLEVKILSKDNNNIINLFISATKELNNDSHDLDHKIIDFLEFKYWNNFWNCLDFKENNYEMVMRELIKVFNLEQIVFEDNDFKITINNKLWK